MGDTNSTLMLAKMYAKGNGVQKNVDAALSWYERSARLIHNSKDSTPASASLQKMIESDAKMTFCWIIM